MTNLRKQSRDNDQASMSDESDYDESDDADRVLGVDDHIFPVAETYWCADYKFSNLHDDELQDEVKLWLSAISWAIVADRGEMELSPLFKPLSVSALVLPLQFGADSISWYSALRECWIDANLLPVHEDMVYGSKLLSAQKELARGAAGSTPLEHVSQGSVPVQPIDPVDPPSSTPFDPGDILPSLCDLDPSGRGSFPAARTYCTHWHCGVETTDDNPAHMFLPGLCDCCFGYSAEQCALMQGGCSDHIDPFWCAHEHCENEITWEDRVWNAEDQVWEFLICYSCVGPTSEQCAEHSGSCCNDDAAPRGR